MADVAAKNAPTKAVSKTMALQDKLPNLPIPSLEDTCKRYLRALEALQDEKEHAATKAAVEEFLANDGPKLHQALLEYARNRDSYIEEFWYESYLSHSDPVVLALNPFFVLENDPTPDRGTQLPRAASLIISSLGFIHDLRAGLLEPDTVRGTPLCMDQYSRLFGTSRIPTERGCRMEVHSLSRHIVVLRRGQFYWFDVLDEDNLPLLTEREIQRNLQAIINDADGIPSSEVARGSIGVLSTENRKIWSGLRQMLSTDKHNHSCLEIVDNALFIVCLDDTSPQNLADLCHNFLCGTYELEGGEQVGTCTNRWYDKLQIIVCADGAAGINFEHTGVDGHTVLRFAADIFTEGLMLLARSINPSAPTLFHAKLSPHARSYKLPRGAQPSPKTEKIDTTPKKLEWNLTPELRAGVRFAETRISDLICQNDCQALEFKGYGKNFITSHGFSPDAFVQMAFQAAYYGLYGRIECTYEPAMTKSFLHGRTEAIRTVQPESVNFTKVFYSDATPSQKVAALKNACDRHSKLTRECSQGMGQDRHLYAMYCLAQRQLRNKFNSEPNGIISSPPSPPPEPTQRISKLPSIFSDPGYATLGTSILSTSNCGNPALRLFGFGPVAADGYGIGYIIKDDGISVCASSKHLQTRRFLDTLKGYLLDIQRVLVQLHRSANERPAPFVDHLGILRDSKTGRPIHGASDSSEEDEDVSMPGYSFFDSGEVAKLGRKKKSPFADIGKSTTISSLF
ncbi:acyltransferase ChoActase/COT/CPT [Panaeolus papilionaceus]|nr:acyltransferase ChoActase/COT/CPT [Panaeolus papilionaceus]